MGHESLKYLSAILERENQGSTFFNEGCRLPPDARIDGIERACLALGLPPTKGYPRHSD